LARWLVKDYNISAYTREVFELLEEYVEGIFGGGERQREL